MGILEERSSRRRFTLGARCLVGRHEACDLRIQDPRVSSEHASVHWRGDRWELRDLGSRNGTWVDGRALSPGERATLAQGSVILLGGPGREWVLADAAPPTVAARNARTGEVRVGVGGFLALPDDERPLASVFEDPALRWVLESEDTLRPVRDHEPVSVEGETWVLELPVSSGPTWAGTHDPLLEEIGLRLAVSRDEEHVEVVLLHAARQIPLPPRSYHYLLLTLARLRLGDTADASSERGWVEREDLCRMLAVDALKLNTDICRLRKQLGEAGVRGAAGVVARRAGTGQLRVGVARIEITGL
jgi:hypothetical protein